MSRLIRTLAATGLGYVCGLLPSARLASRLASGGSVDLASAGSGNPGARNAAAVLGTGWGFAVLGGDLAKGVVASRVGLRLGGSAGGYAAGAASIAGHVFPVNAGFEGGKGAATSAGASAVLFPAYFPIDVAVAVLAAERTDVDLAIKMSSVVWTVAALAWWRKGWPNAWGPPPTAGLPAFTAASSVVMLARLELNRRAAALRTP